MNPFPDILAVIIPAIYCVADIVATIIRQKEASQKQQSFTLYEP